MFHVVTICFFIHSPAEVSPNYLPWSGIETYRMGVTLTYFGGVKMRQNPEISCISVWKVNAIYFDLIIWWSMCNAEGSCIHWMVFSKLSTSTYSYRNIICSDKMVAFRWLLEIFVTDTFCILSHLLWPHYVCRYAICPLLERQRLQNMIVAQPLSNFCTKSHPVFGALIQCLA